MKKSLYFCTLLALSLLVLPKAANAETYTLSTAPSGYDNTGIANTNGKYTGVWLDKDDPQWWDAGWSNVPETDTDPAGRNVYNILASGTILLTGVSEDDGSVSAVLTNDSTGEFNLGNISISGETPSNTLYGFLYMEDTSFAGTVNGGNVNVSTTDGSEIVGVYFRVLANGTGANGGNKQDLEGADITFNNINVKAGNADLGIVADGAAGFAAGNVDAATAISLRSVTAEGEWATGVEFAGKFNGELTIDGTGSGAGVIKATSTGNNEARGLLLTGGVGSGGTINVGSIEAAAKEDGQEHATAIGIYVGYLDPTNSATPVFSDLDAGSEIKVGDIKASGMRASGIFVTGETNGKLDIGNIDAIGKNDVAAGFWSMGSVGSTADLKFGNIYVTAEDGAQGIAVGTGAGGADFEGKLITGWIDVYSEASNGTGTTAGITVDGNFLTASGSYIGAISAEAATTDNVYGIVVTASGNQSIFDASSISAKNNGAGGAFGIAAQGGLTNGSSVTSGTITATAKDGDATGIKVGSEDALGNPVGEGVNDSSIYVVGNISATTTNGTAIGIDVYKEITDSNINITGDISVTSSGSSGIGSASGIRVGRFEYDPVGDTYVPAGGGVTDSNIKIEGSVSAKSTIGNEDEVVSGIFIAAGLISTDKDDPDKKSSLQVGGSVTAETTKGHAAGIQVWGDFTEGSSIVVGSTVKADARNSGNTATGSAVGIFLEKDAAGDITIPTVTVDANNSQAVGIQLGGAENSGTITTGSITATSTGNRAYGVYSDGDVNLVLTSTYSSAITATGHNDNDSTAGIYAAGETNITLSPAEYFAPPITINVTGRKNTGTISSPEYEDTVGIWSGGALNIDLAGNILNTNGVRVEGNNMTVVGVGDTEFGGGVATLGIVDLGGGNLIIGDGRTLGANETPTTVSIDFVKDETDLGNANELNTDGKLIVNAVKDYNRGETLATFSIYDNSRLDGGHYKVYFDASGHLLYGGLSQISDVRLAALMLHNRNAAWHSVRDRLISGSGRMRLAYERHDYRGQSFDPRALYSINGGEAEAWVNYTGRSETLWSPYHEKNWKLTSDGIQAGTDLWRTRCEQLGIFFGYESGKTVNSGDKVKVDDPYFGVYAARVFYDGTDFRGAFAYGWQKYNMKRVDDLYDRHTTLFQGRTSETHLEIGRRTSAGPWSLRPVLGADVFTNDLNAVWEAKGDTDIYYGKTNLTQVFLRAGSDLRFRRGFFTFNSGVYYSYDVASDADKKLRTAAWEQYWDDGTEKNKRDKVSCDGTKLGRSLLTFNAGGECQLSEWFSVVGGYQGEYVFDRSHSVVQHTGYVGGAWQW